jgi:hypothetical protein
VAAVRGIEWYHLRPTGWVFADLRSGDTRRALRAWNELERREVAGLLSGKRRDELADVALDEQRKEKALPFVDRMVDYLAGRVERGQLDERRQSRFFEQAMAVRLELYPEKVWPGDHTVGCTVVSTGRGPTTYARWWHSMNVGDRWLDGAPAHGTGTINCARSSLDCDGGGFNVDFGGPAGDDLPHGPHTVSVSLRLKAFRGAWHYGRETSPPIYVRDVRLSTTFEAETRGGPLLFDRQFTDAVRASVTAEAVEVAADRHSWTILIDVSPPLPCDLALEARLDDGREKERYFDGFHVPRGVSARARLRLYDPPTPAPKSVDLFLRSSEVQAHALPERHSVWYGELRLRGVPVRQEATGVCE